MEKLTWVKEVIHRAGMPTVVIAADVLYRFLEEIEAVLYKYADPEPAVRAAIRQVQEAKENLPL